MRVGAERTGLYAQNYENAVRGKNSQTNSFAAAQKDGADSGSHAEAVLRTQGMTAQEYAGCYGTESYQYAVLKQKEYEAELEDARLNDPQKYAKMMKEKEESTAKSFRQVEAQALANGGTTTYNGVPLTFTIYSESNKVMSVGDISSGEVINAGRLSNGYVFQFNMENVESIILLKDLFSPADLNQILEAITVHKMKEEAKVEVEDMDAGEVSVNQTTHTEDSSETDSTKGTVTQESGKPDRLESSFAVISAGEAEQAEGEKNEITHEIVKNADGSRNLIITMLIGEQEVITKIPLSPVRENSPYQIEKGNTEYEKQFVFAVQESEE